METYEYSKVIVSVVFLKGVLKMKRFYLFLVIAVMGAFVFAGNVSAVSLPNPNPALFGDDLDDSGIFVPSASVVSLEIFDLGPFAGIGGAEFGFFFEGADVSNPANLITIFDPLDQDPDPGGIGSILQIAFIDFSAGTVIDFDDGSTPSIQDTFVTSTANIGFWLLPDPLLGIPTLFTVPSLNAGGVDVAATFPILGLPGNGFLFAFEDPTGLIPLGTPLTFEFVAGIGITPVPEPATFILFGSGLVGLVLYGYGRKRFKGLGLD